MVLARLKPKALPTPTGNRKLTISWHYEQDPPLRFITDQNPHGCV